MRGQVDQGLLLGRRRLRLVGALFAIAFLTLAFRLADLALWQGDGGLAGASALASALGSPRRADIVDRNGALLATDYPKTSIYADPALVLDPAAAARSLAAVLSGVGQAELLARLKEPRRFVWLKRHVTEAEERAVVRLGLPGIAFRTEFHRIYPQRALAAHLVGYVGVENQGLAGVERAFEDRLTGAASEAPLVLTLDLAVQEVVRSELASARARFAAEGATAIVLEVGSGELLASVSLPDFDPHRYQQARPEALFNRNTLGTYELGSLFKLFTAAMALDAGVVDITEVIDAREPLSFGRYRINDFHAKRRLLSLAEVIAFSSNIGAAKMAQALGSEGQLAYFERFGLLARHPIRLLEVGQPQRPATWRPINTVTAAYGHGLAVSPLQVADAVAAAVCAAPRPRAHLVAEEVPPLWPEMPVSAATAAQLRWLMWLTVTEGTGKLAKVPGYLVGGKTGSADKPGRGGYRARAVVASFVAAFPIDRPRYVVLVTLDEPTGDDETFGQAQGGWTAAPTVARIISRIGPLLGLPPVAADAETWFRERLVEGQALNGRTGRIEPSFAAQPGADWQGDNQGDPACGCRTCSILG